MKKEKLIIAIVSFILGFTITSLITHYLLNH
jgi:hypothetical protein